MQNLCQLKYDSQLFSSMLCCCAAHRLFQGCQPPPPSPHNSPARDQVYFILYVLNDWILIIGINLILTSAVWPFQDLS